MEDYYIIIHRNSGKEEEISTKETMAIIKKAGLHAGPYGGMGAGIDRMLCRSSEEEGNIIVAVRYLGKWLDIPEHQDPYIAHELANTSYEED